MEEDKTIPDETGTNGMGKPESDSYEALPAADDGESAIDQPSYDSDASLEAGEDIEEEDIEEEDLGTAYVPEPSEESENVPDPETDFFEEGTSASASVSNDELYALVQENFSVTIEMMAVQTGIMVLILGMVIFRFIHRLFSNMVTKYLS